jgi:hypothetical protein
VIAIPYKEGVENPGAISYVNGVMVLTKILPNKKPRKNPGLHSGTGKLRTLPEHGTGASFCRLQKMAVSPKFLGRSLVVKYKAQVETMIENSTRGRLFGFTGGNTIPASPRFQGRTCWRKPCN